MAPFRMKLPLIRSVSSVLTGVMVCVSLLVALFPSLGGYVLLIPSQILSQPWSVLTYGFVAVDPLGVIFGVLLLIGIGGALERGWGSRRLAIFAVAVTALAGAATVLTALLWAPARTVYPGSSVMTGALWVAYGLWVGHRQTNFWGLPLTGTQFALVGVGFVTLNGVFYGAAVVLPSAFALGFTYLTAHGMTPGGLWQRLRSWQLTRRLNRRSTKLKVIAGNKRNMPNDSDRFLH